MSERRRPVILPLGSDLRAWIELGGRPDRGGRWIHLLIGWQSFWFERALALQRKLPRPGALPVDPIFIMGLWRSGTTRMHELLGTFSNVRYPATWECMNASGFQLRRPPRFSAAEQRPMDEISIDAFSPQEDEFALLALGVPSVYRGFIDPRRLNELEEWLEPGAWAADRPPGWFDRWLEFLSGISGASAAEGRRRLLLKSPNHVYRIRALRQAFPNAAYVWMIRDPTETFASNRKMWTAMFERYALWRWDAALLEAFLAKAFEEAAACLASASREIPDDRLVIVDMNSLAASPLETVRKINERLQISEWTNEQQDAVRRSIPKSGHERTQSPVQNMLPVTTAAIEHLSEAQRVACSMRGLGDG